LLHSVDPTGAADPEGAGGRVVVEVVGVAVVDVAVVGGDTGAATGAAVVVVAVAVEVVVVAAGTIEVAELSVGAACCRLTILASQLRNAHQSHEGPRAFAGTTVPVTITTTTNHATMGRPLPPERCMGTRVGRAHSDSSLSVVIISL